MPSASHGNTAGPGPPGRPVRASGWVDDSYTSPIQLKAHRAKKEPPIPVPRVAHSKGNTALLSVGGEWALKECEDHTTWVNEILKQQDYRPVEDLRRGCSDGVTLVHITELLCNERPAGIHGLPVLKSHKIQNVGQCLNLLDARGVEVDQIKAEELVEGNLKSTLTLMKNIRAKFDSRPIGPAVSGAQSSPSSYSTSSTPQTLSEKPKAMPGVEFINGGLEMLPGIMGDKEEETSQKINPVPKMSTTEMDAHGVLQHQLLAPARGPNGGGHSPDSLNASKSCPLRGGGHTPVGFTPNQVSVPNSMTVEEKLKSLLTNNNHNDNTYDDGELLLPPPPNDRSESFEDEVFDNSAFSPDHSPDMTVKSAGPSKKDPNAGYVPSRPTERRYGPRGEVLLERQYRPPPPYRPRNIPTNQSPPRQPGPLESPNMRRTPELRDACNRMYGGGPQTGGPPNHMRQPPPYRQPTDRMRHPAVPPRRNIVSGPNSNIYGSPQHLNINNYKQSVQPKELQQTIYAVPNSKSQGRDSSPNHDGFGRDVSPNHPVMGRDVSPSGGVSHQDYSHIRDKMGKDVPHNESKNGPGMGLQSPGNPSGEFVENKEKLNTHVTFNLNREQDRYGDRLQGHGSPEFVHLHVGEQSRPIGLENLEVKVESSGARRERSPDRRINPQRSPSAPHNETVKVSIDEVKRSESYRLENRRPAEEGQDQNRGAVQQESLQTSDMARNEAVEAQSNGERGPFVIQNITGVDFGATGTKRDSVAGQGHRYTVGPTHEQQIGIGHSQGGRHDQNSTIQPMDEVDLVAMHNLSAESGNRRGSAVEEETRLRHSVSESGAGRNHNSVDGHHHHFSPGYDHNQRFDRLGPQDERRSHQNTESIGAYQTIPHSENLNNRQIERQHGGLPNQGHLQENPHQGRFRFSWPEQRTSFDCSSSLSSENLPKLGDPFQDPAFDNGLPNIRDFEFSGSGFSSRSVTPPLPPLSPSNTPPRTPPLLHSPRGGLGPPRQRMLSPRQNTPSSRYPQGARKTPDLLTNMDHTQEIFIDGPGVTDQISITPPGSPHGKYKVWNNPYTAGRVSLPSPKQRRKKRAKSGKKPAGHHVSFAVDDTSSDDSYEKNSSGLGDHDVNASNLGNLSQAATSQTQEISLVRKQLDGLETMYQEILKILGIERDYLPPSPDGKGMRFKGHRRPTSKDIKNISKRFARLESHVVTLARSVAHLSSEMRSQNVIYQDLEMLKQEVKTLKEQKGSGNYYGANDWERFRGWVPSLTNPKRVEKLKKFFGQEPPLLRIFLKKLGYEKYATNFDTEHIGMVELPYMTEKRLQDIGIPMGPRLRILQEAQLCFRQENFNIYIV